MTRSEFKQKKRVCPKSSVSVAGSRSPFLATFSVLGILLSYRLNDAYKIYIFKFSRYQESLITNINEGKHALKDFSDDEDKC